MNKKNIYHSFIILGSLLTLGNPASLIHAQEETSAFETTVQDTRVTNSSIQINAAYTNGIPVRSGATITLSNESSTLSKVFNQDGIVSFNENDGLVNGTSYSVSINENSNLGQFVAGSDIQLDITVPLKGASNPLEVTINLAYTNANPVGAGKKIILTNLLTGESISKEMTNAGQIIFTQEDGLKKGVNYGVWVDDINIGHTFRYDLGGQKTLDITMKLPGAYLPLSVQLNMQNKDALKVPKGSTVTLTNLSTLESISKVLTEEGTITFTAEDGLKKEVNYGVAIDSINMGHTFRFDLGGDKVLDIPIDGFEKDLKLIPLIDNSQESSIEVITSTEVNATETTGETTIENKTKEVTKDTNNETTQVTKENKNLLPQTGEKNIISMILFGIILVLTSILLIATPKEEK